jgi:hypothetical protein
MTAHSNIVQRLRTEHARLETALAEERRRPAPDDRRIRELKQRKLALKDRIWTTELGQLLAPAR